MKSFCVLLVTYCVTAIVLMQKNAFAQAACSGESILNESSGTLNVPGNATIVKYGGFDCSWTISVATGKVVNVTFTQFYLPLNLSKNLYLYVMENERSVYGDRLIGTDLPKSFTSKTNEIKISYYLYPASSLGQFQNIQLMWQETEPVNTTVTNFNCGSLITDSEGTFTSPGFPNNYANNLDCQWMISASTDQFVTISFTAFVLEPSSLCLFDYLTISSSQKTQKLCSSFATISMQGPVTIHFHSDDSVAWKGFSLSYLVGDRSITACSSDGLNINAPTGNLVNLRIPNIFYYYCVWKFVVDSGKILQFTFHQLDVPCGKGSVALSDLPYVGIPLTLCGTTLPKSVQSTTNTFEIVFSTEFDTNVSTSFNLSWTSVNSKKETVSVNACTNTMSGLKGYITSPNYPNNYTNNLDLCWTIENPNNHIVLMQAVDFDLENAIGCQYDYLILHNSSTTKFLKLCKQQGLRRVEYVQFDTMVGAIFHSDQSIVARGFVLAYAMQDSNTGSVIDKSCGTTNLTDKSGFMSSPGFPFFVNSVSTCQWTITAPTNQVIEVNFLTMDIPLHPPCSVDDTYLEFRVGHPTASLKRFCSSQGPVLIRSNELSITYRLSSYPFNFGDPPILRFLLHYEMKDFYLQILGGLYALPSNLTSNLWQGYSTGGPRSESGPFECSSRTASDSCFWPHLQSWASAEPFSGGKNVISTSSPVFTKSKMRMTNCVKTDIFVGAVQRARGANASVPTGVEITSTSLNSESVSREDEITSTGSCGRTLSTSSSFRSPKFPSNYLNHLDCYWRLPVRKNEVVEVHLGSIDLEVSENCSADVLEIYGADNSLLFRQQNYKTFYINDTSIVKNIKLQITNLTKIRSFHAFCDFLHVGSFNFTGTDVIIHFRTDYAVTKSGFSGYFTSYMEGESPSAIVASNSSSTAKIESSTENLTTTSNLSPSDIALDAVPSTTIKTTSSTQGLHFEHTQFLVVSVAALLVQMI